MGEGLRGEIASLAIKFPRKEGKIDLQEFDKSIAQLQYI